MFKMVNRYGNAHKIAKTERERDELLRAGYKLEEETAVTGDKTDIDKMTVDQLENYAKEKNIDLTGCNNKAEKLAKIKESITD